MWQIEWYTETGKDQQYSSRVLYYPGDYIMTEIDMNIYSLNCNGLSDDVKRNAVFEKLKKKGEGIFLLQETHCTAKMNKNGEVNGVTICIFQTEPQTPGVWPLL